MIGVHTPEFAFEKKIANVEKAVADLQIDYPVAIDNDFAIWRAFFNQYWPAHYFIDPKGQIRYHHFGEGEYERGEQVIRQLLAEAGQQPMPGEGKRFDQGQRSGGRLRPHRRRFAGDVSRVCPGGEFHLARRRTAEWEPSL